MLQGLIIAVHKSC